MDQGSGSDWQQGLHAVLQKTAMETGASGIHLKLDKTQDFLDRLQQRISEGEDKKYQRVRECKKMGKAKSSSFCALKVKVGIWQKLANNENDIVVKFYFNRERFLWEILDNQRKMKMDISLHHILSFRAVFNEETTNLFIELEKPPAFLMEAGSVAQKHTTWTTIRDFTGGEGLKHRFHVLTFRKEVLGKKQYEKIIYSKAMLYLKSCTIFPSSNSMFFDNVGSIFLSNDPHGNSASQDQQQAAVTVQGSGSFPLDQNSSVGNGVCNHGLTGWGNRESTMEDYAYFSGAYYVSPSRQILDPSLGMPRTGNEHQGTVQGVNTLVGQYAEVGMKAIDCFGFDMSISEYGSPLLDLQRNPSVFSTFIL